MAHESEPPAGDIVVRITGVEMPDKDDSDAQHDALNDLCAAATSALAFGLEDDPRFEGAQAVAEVPTVVDEQAAGSVPERGCCPRCEREVALSEPYVDPDDPLRVKAALECDECFFVADAALTVVDAVDRRPDEA